MRDSAGQLMRHKRTSRPQLIELDPGARGGSGICSFMPMADRDRSKPKSTHER